MLHCQELANVEDAEAYRTWNMGQGLLLVTPEPDEVVRQADAEGFEARLAGHISEEPVIDIVSKGFRRTSQQYLNFPVEKSSGNPG